MTAKPSSKVTMAAIETARENLRHVPPAPKETEEVGMKGAIEALTPTIRGLIAKRYSRERIVGLLKEQGIECTVATLRTYFRAKAPRKKATGAAMTPMTSATRPPAAALRASIPADATTTLPGAPRAGAEPRTMATPAARDGVDEAFRPSTPTDKGAPGRDRTTAKAS